MFDNLKAFGNNTPNILIKNFAKYTIYNSAISISKQGQNLSFQVNLPNSKFYKI
jgi:hypothetical protein